MKKSLKPKSPLARKAMASEAMATNRSSLPTAVPAMRSAVSTNSLADHRRSNSPSSSVTQQQQQHHQPADAKERKERQMRRWTADYDELRVKLERDKTEALNTQKEAMNRAFRVQLAKLLKEKEELVRKVQSLQQAKDAPQSAHTCNKAGTGGASPGGGPPGTLGNQSSGPGCPSAVELQKLVHENNILRIDKKKQDEQLQLMKESEQHRFENMRSLLDDKARELTMLQKQLRQQIARLREESKAKDRVISHLEAELRVQSGRAQQFRDILEQSLLSANGSAARLQNGQVNNDELIARERRLQLQLEDLRETSRQQQETFAQEKRELLRRLSEKEHQQGPIRQKNKQYLVRNVQLSAKNQQLTDSLQKNAPPTINEPSAENGTSTNGANGSHPNSGNMTTDLKRSLTRPSVNQFTCPSTNDKQRRIEYVQQIQKLRKEQRYYSMWELPPLLEVETDGHGVEGGSDGSLSPAATSGVTSCSSDSAWNEETRRELEMLFSQLSREHSDLQRNYQMLHEKLHQLTCFSDSDANNVNYATLLADYKAARARIRDLEEILQLKNAREREASDAAKNGQPTPAVPSLLEIQAKFVREKHAMQAQMVMLTRRLEEANHRHQTIQAELNETRDQNELLEFRILELEESQERNEQAVPYTADHPDRKDVCTDTDSDDLSVGDSGIMSLNSLMVDCPSPTLHSSSSTSPDSDYLSEKISTVKGELQLMVSSLSDPSQKTVLAQLQALLGVCQSRLTHKGHHPISSTTQSAEHHWEWQLQESGIFEEDHHHQHHHHHADASNQTDPEPIQVQQNGDVSIRVTIPLPLSCIPLDKETQVDRPETLDSTAVQAAVEVTDSQVQCDPPALECKTFEDQAVQVSTEPPATVEQTSQTEESVMTITDFRDIESYYMQQIELLQKEKASHRKKFQASREEAQQTVQQLELLGRQFQERERQFEDILQKNCRAFERELELARNESSAELATLKECLQLVWHEVKDYATVSDVPKTSVMEFTQALINALHDICSELGSLRVRVVQLADMEQAFQTTLQQADGLVHHIEEKHLSRIRELEQTEHELRNQLEQQNLHRFDDEGEESLEIKIIELEQKNDVLAAQAGKCQELEEYCQQLHGRLEDYEQRERSFQMAVQEVERRCSAREQRLREEVESLRHELERCRESETCWRQRLEQREGQLSLMRNELETEQKTIASLEAELKDLQSKLEKDDTSFRNEVTKLRSQLNISMGQLNELELLNCQLREQVAEYQDQIVMLQRCLEKESSQSQELVAENNRLMQAQLGMLMANGGVPVGKPLTEELFEVESDEGCPPVPPTDTDSSGCVDVTVATTLDDFSEISLPTTPTVVDGCNNVFEEHFKVLESLENYLETQQIVNLTGEDNDESGISTSPSIHENESVALLEAQLSQLRTEKHFLLNSVVNSQKKDEIIQILIEQLKYNAPRQYLLETASQIRKIVSTSAASTGQHPTKDKDIDRVCQLLEAPVDLIGTTDNCNQVPQQPSSLPSNCNNTDVNNSLNKVFRRQTTVTVLPEEDPLLSQPSDLRITRKVGQDGLVIAWLPSSDSDCVGYLICVNGQEAQRVRNVQRTKAVLCGLDLLSEMEICIYSLSADGLISSPTSAYYRPGEQEGDSEVESGQNGDMASPRDVVVQTFYTNSSVTIRSSRRLSNPAGAGSRIPVRSSVP